MPSRASRMAEARPPGPAPTMATRGGCKAFGMDRQPSVLLVTGKTRNPTQLEQPSSATRGKAPKEVEIRELLKENETVSRLFLAELHPSQAIDPINPLAQKYEHARRKSKRLILAFLKLSFTSN
ncbi:hypothetical protein [Microvirga vignae]|uniref:hypothetical protein n=1 Tax=Microvirga vignae TaxID=1225564 RepID=UPI0013963D1F|nr:hypothetical protein [Microvirga vignae]